ncbi:BTAD domain-containing putative transcriptional regulator [Kitasatospora sp. NPDC097643]|uniref:AfsR/SARP family transcriptional regulator n=1 Tax=Kitasatospora sp. NPDC097643 TaxID=3157230 RepID=UPI00331B3132
MVRTRGDLPPAAAPTTHQAQLFGLFRVVRDGSPLGDPAWGRASARTLLKWFLLNPGQRFRPTELSEVLWPGCTRSPANRLHVTQHALRHALEPELPSRRPSTFIRSDADGRSWFDPGDRWWTDVDEVARLAKAARAAQDGGDTAAAITCYERMLAHYSRGFLPEDLYEDAFTPFRTAHDLAHSETLRRLLRLYRGTGQRYEALNCAMGILDRDPYSEEAVVSVVEVQVEQGCVTAAISELERFVRTVERDLGTPPSRELLTLQERVRHAR